MEKRKSPRIAVQLPISFSGNEIAGGGFVSCLSTGGCTVISEETVQSGTFLVLHIHLPGQYSPLKVDLAEVQRALGGEFGLTFLRMASHEQERLRRFLRSLETESP